VIRSIRHRGLRLLYERGERRGVPARRADQLEVILALLDIARSPADLRLPGFRLHRLQGRLADLWSISVSGNWRIVFRWEDGDVYDVDLVDYH
jgi:proteic killer suppression protein